jgi:hypothetical protein
VVLAFPTSSVAVFVCLTACSGDAGSLRQRTGDPGFRALVYSRAFAERFALPVEGSVSLEPGVLGMALQVTQAADLNPNCLLYLYVDHSLPLAYPDKTQDSLENLDPLAGPLFFVTKLNDEDGTASNARLSDMPVLFLSRAYAEKQKRGVTDGGPAWAYYRDLLPGLNVIVYSAVCSGLDPANGPADLWLRRSGHEDADLDPVTPSADVAVRIAVPMPLLEASAVATSRAAKQPLVLKRPPSPKYVVPGKK